MTNAAAFAHPQGEILVMIVNSRTEGGRGMGDSDVYLIRRTQPYFGDTQTHIPRRCYSRAPRATPVRAKISHPQSIAWTADRPDHFRRSIIAQTIRTATLSQIQLWFSRRQVRPRLWYSAVTINDNTHKLTINQKHRINQINGNQTKNTESGVALSADRPTARWKNEKYAPELLPFDQKVVEEKYTIISYNVLHYFILSYDNT